MKKKDLEYCKTLLAERKVQIQKNIEGYSKEMESMSDQELNDDGDYAAVSADNMVESTLSSKQVGELKEIELALKKIHDGTYGICDMCDEPISLARLKVKPHAKYCIDCREIVEKNQTEG